MLSKAAYNADSFNFCFEIMGFIFRFLIRNLFLYCGCVVYHKLLFLKRVSGSLSVSVYMKIF